MVGRVVRTAAGAVLAAAGLVDLLPDGTPAPAVAVLGVAMLGLGVAAGLLVLVLVPLCIRYRPDPVSGTAPSGRPALYFRHSPVLRVAGVGCGLAVVGWLGTAAVVLVGSGYVVAAVPPAVLAVLLAVPVGRALTGAAGGLWLTRSGIEYRLAGGGWSVAWTEVRGVVARPTRRTVGPALAPVALVLRPGARARIHGTVGVRNGSGGVGIECVALAGGRERIAATIERCVTDPRFRERLGARPPGRVQAAGPALG